MEKTIYNTKAEPDIEARLFKEYFGDYLFRRIVFESVSFRVEVLRIT